jgi:putative acetyltransferase
MVANTTFVITAEAPDSADVLALLDRHLEEMHRCSPACKVHALPAKRLAETNVTFFTARVDGELAAIGALREIDAKRGEIKSMRAADDWRGKGAGKAMLRHLLAEARVRGYIWIGLETGRHPVFEPAQRLYASHGFRECPSFGDYLSDDFSLCMGLDLT